MEFIKINYGWRALNARGKAVTKYFVPLISRIINFVDAGIAFYARVGQFVPFTPSVQLGERNFAGKAVSTAISQYPAT